MRSHSSYLLLLTVALVVLAVLFSSPAAALSRAEVVDQVRAICTDSDAERAISLSQFFDSWLVLIAQLARNVASTIRLNERGPHCSAVSARQRGVEYTDDVWELCLRLRREIGAATRIGVDRVYALLTECGASAVQLEVLQQIAFDMITTWWEHAARVQDVGLRNYDHVYGTLERLQRDLNAAGEAGADVEVRRVMAEEAGESLSGGIAELVEGLRRDAEATRFVWRSLADQLAEGVGDLVAADADEL